jgi:hypothetical protein
MYMTIEQTDKLGQTLEVGDIVIVPESTTTLEFGKITKLTPKGARVDILRASTNSQTKQQTKWVQNKVKRADAIIKVNPSDAMYLKLKGDI